MSSLAANEWYLNNRDKISQITGSTGKPRLRDASSVDKPSVSKESKASSGPLKTALQLVFSFFVVCVSTAVLISASLEVFGYGVMGWAKALLIEIAIPALAIWSTPVVLTPTVLGKWNRKFLTGFWRAFLVKGTMISLISISLFVVKANALSEETKLSQDLVSRDSVLIGLKAEVESWNTLLKEYSPSRVTDRRNALLNISKLNEKIEIREKLVLSNSNTSSNTFDLSAAVLANTALQATLILLNIIFGHALWSKLNDCLELF